MGPKEICAKMVGFNGGIKVHYAIYVKQYSGVPYFKVWNQNLNLTLIFYSMIFKCKQALLLSFNPWDMLVRVTKEFLKFRCVCFACMLDFVLLFNLGPKLEIQIFKTNDYVSSLKL